MSVKIGKVATFADVQADKAQALKVLEEAAEVFAAWQQWDDSLRVDKFFELVDECADVVQATCNLLASLGMDDFTNAMERCEKRNRERGRL